MKTLIIEDDFTCAHLLGATLDVYGEVSLARDPVVGFELYKEAIEADEPFNLICLDLELPEYDGLEFLNEIRQTERELGIEPNCGVCVFITTGHSDPQTYYEANAVGCDVFLSKPLDRKKLTFELKRFGLIA